MGELIDKAKGKTKRVIGEATDDHSLEAEGHVDTTKGKVKGAVEDVKNAVKNVKKEPSYQKRP